PSITPISSMRLLVVSGSAPEDSSDCPLAGWWRMNAHPPGPGLPLQAPSVNNRTKSKSAGAAASDSIAWSFWCKSAPERQESGGRVRDDPGGLLSVLPDDTDQDSQDIH